MNKDFQEISIVFFEAFQNGVKKSSGRGDQPCDEVIFRVNVALYFNALRKAYHFQYI